MTNIIENYKHVVFKKYATFEGRARRSEYWYFILASLIITAILGVVDGVIGAQMGIDPKTATENGLLSSIYSILVLVPTVAAGVRRIHDSNKSGWWILLPLYNLYLFIRKGTEGANRFGPDQTTLEVAPTPGVESTPQA